MGDSKSSPSSKPGGSPSKSSKETPDRAQMSQRSQSDSATSGLTRSFSASHAPSSSARERRPSKESLGDMADDDNNDDESFEDEEQEADPKPTITKRHSSSSHTNLYTECGRHGDDWLFGGITDAVKSVKTVFGKSEKK